ncbi:serine/threonine-protein kinase [Chondromyces crocatus]|uniref:Protein kinase n=1 Tax=Chondromyces crocatus TaxID=52 RepID=A0A0K1EDQ6_CHOCO|nr:serine/threonine-protein kinase [Chondromyces crocatus]AKT38817.1 protein kinase [Chondromyces crocatus]
MEPEPVVPEHDTLEDSASPVHPGGCASPQAETAIVPPSGPLVSGLTAEHAIDVTPGTVIAGKYRVERLLGKGGMGQVVAAEHLELRERVALKLLLPECLESGQALARFLHEARAAAKIKGEHVARVLDAGKLDTGVPYIVMEYLDGQDLAAVLVSEGKMPVRDAVELVLQVCEAIAEAHTVGVVHRDLKPSNLFLTRRPDGSAMVKVLDFGISKTIRRDGEEAPVSLHMTRTRQVLGSPLYMSPEQLTSARSVGPTADIWSLGAILFELVTGAPPFAAPTMSELRQQILFEPAPSLRLQRPDAPRRLEKIIHRCMEKDPANRYADVAALTRDLRALAPPRARPSIDRVHAIYRNAGMSEADLGIAPVGRRRGIFVAVAAGSLVAGIIAAFAWSGLTTKPSEAPAPALESADHADSADRVEVGEVPAPPSPLEPSAQPSALALPAKAADISPATKSPEARSAATSGPAPAPTLGAGLPAAIGRPAAPVVPSTVAPSAARASEPNSPPSPSASTPFLYNKAPLKKW